MRLWHEALIPYLPRQQLLGLHREICGMRGKGWGKKHATVDYVFTHPMGWLIAYHKLVMSEMIRRGYKVADEWKNVFYRGKAIGYEYNWDLVSDGGDRLMRRYVKTVDAIYPEHNDEYLKECLDNLKEKGVEIDFNYYIEPKFELPEVASNGMWLRSVKQ